MDVPGRLTWEQAIDYLRNDERYTQLIRDAYLDADLLGNCERFAASEEFIETLRVIRELAPAAKTVLDVAAGNGIASYAFALEGFKVVALDPDPSESVGNRAIAQVRQSRQLNQIDVVSAHGERLPFPDHAFDVVYVRQALHHARQLNTMLTEIARVLKRGGLLIATREPVIDSDAGLQEFLQAQPDHLLYGGEWAYRHERYTNAIEQSKLRLLRDMTKYDSIISLYPQTQENLREAFGVSRVGRVLRLFLPATIAFRVWLNVLKWIDHEQGRLHSFVAVK